MTVEEIEKFLENELSEYSHNPTMFFATKRILDFIRSAPDYCCKETDLVTDKNIKNTKFCRVCGQLFKLKSYTDPAGDTDTEWVKTI
jgi:hypothetical protein